MNFIIWNMFLMNSKEEFEFQVIKTDSTTTEPFLMMGMELLNDRTWN